MCFPLSVGSAVVMFMMICIEAKGAVSHQVSAGARKKPLVKRLNFLFFKIFVQCLESCICEVFVGILVSPAVSQLSSDSVPDNGDRDRDFLHRHPQHILEFPGACESFPQEA